MMIHEKFAPSAEVHGGGHAAWPLSSSQARIWRLSETGNEDVYGRQILAIGFHPASLCVARDALETLLALYPELSRRFQAQPGGLVHQSVSHPPSVDRLELSLANDDAVDHVVATAAEEERLRPIDPGRDSAARFILFVRQGQAVAALFSLHPLIGDFAALDRVASNFVLAIHAPDQWNREAATMSAPAPVERVFSAKLLDGWYERLSARESVAMLPQEAQTAVPDGEARWTEHAVEIAHEDAFTIGDPADGAADMAPNRLLTALAITLRRYSGYGTQRLGLVRRGLERDTVSRSEDLLVIQAAVDGNMPLRIVQETFARETSVAEEQFMPFEMLAEAMLRRDELFDTTSLARTVLDVRPAFFAALPPYCRRGIRVIATPQARRDAEFVVTVSPSVTGSFHVRFGYDAARHAPMLVQRFARDFQTAFLDCAEAPERLVKDIPFMSRAELDRLSEPYPDEPEADDGTPVHKVISVQARRRPTAFAVAQGARTITHGDLEARANRLAHHLVRLGVRAEKRVAIALDKSIEAIIAILAVMKAGGAFTPVEPDHPEARNRHILTSSGLALIITSKRFIDKLPMDIASPLIELDALDLSQESATPPEVAIAPDQLAYVIYTSGSTGVPKGVAVEHGPLAHHCKSTLRIYEMSEASREYPVLPFTSDGGHERWMVPLMAGGGVVLAEDKLATPEEAFVLMRRHGVNNASLPTSYVRSLAEYAGENPAVPHLRLYSFGGEALPKAVFDMINDNLQARLLINGYGPTETIMTPMIWKILPGTRFEGTVAPIGRGVGDRRIYVLDADGAPVPVGVIGEIYIGGSGLARGYLDRPDLTAERFVPDPFSDKGGRLYRSGDLGRWREDGIVEFAGRVDHQIKLRGYRIEPGEIEAVLRANAEIADVVVTLHEDGGRSFLVAYVVPKADAGVDAPELKRAAARLLPDYMVPQAIMVLDALPMGPNSKLDRAALPAPRMEWQAVEPGNEREREILDVWQDILEIGDIGVTENFFEIGGQSLAAVRIVSRLKTRHPEWPLTIADMFNHPTVRELAAAVEERRDEGSVDVVYLRRSGDRPVLYCFPGLLVSTREYLRLVDHLGPQQPATGFICYSLTETKTLSTTVQDITARYAEAVRREAKGRPCAFLGWSWGGLLAYEAARQLGSDVDLKMIGMVDVCDMDEEFTIGVRPRFAAGVRERTQQAVRQWLESTPMREEWRTLFDAMDDEVYEQFLYHVVKHNVVLPTDGPDIGSEEHTFWVLVDNAMIFRSYRLKASDYRIHSFVAEDSLTRALNIIDWRRHSPNATASEIVTGTNHLTIIGKTPFHQRFAKRLEEAFRTS
ncbi:amino acid adenylation domain-containing protein [Sinorhizobium meliloti]|uniref:non-ribosomal peptide synthetase n=3 Tax=Rhizobium meliloti TaxID=382 RepID=UPI000D1F7D0A|nr:amino acid adenylation domain-containing protein [Sinorhizobium meliloti]MDW9640022.1 amino acid adenylation domain-containing protein [Sinorhizobium meliloti]MDW9670205.1 amino acid adenylation domain-containing protein [Sinorhizobium meliloti]MDW9812794.1 amino acid adenylation domain-containing protein [Sinorhizobium meliloti]MDW9856057.1 amino acid adenylation domain-containing protein [Sinorhizobium meliloti]MDW9874212.1 amino acid adenylation domain-containing protein [Sinorhizobium m